MIAHRLLAVCTVFACISQSAAAQATINASVTGTPAAPVLTSAPTAKIPASGVVLYDPAQDLSVVVACNTVGLADCTKLTANEAGSAGKKLLLVNVSGASATIVVPANAQSRSYPINVYYNNVPLVPSPITLTANTSTGSGGGGGAVGGDGGAGAGSSSAPTLKERVRAKQCATATPIDADADFALWLDGTPIVWPSKVLDEGHPVVFNIIGDQSLVLASTAVTRKSALRTILPSNVYGAGVSLPSSVILNGLAGPMACGKLRVVLNDFAAGAAEVQIDVATGGATETNAFDFNVAAMYTGAYTFGAILSTAANPTFGKVYNGADTVVSAGDRGNRLLYVMTYTPFVWGRRDLLSAPDRWYKNLNPTFGVVLNDISNNGIAGVTYDLGGFVYLTWGVHAAHVSALDSASKAIVGGPFDNRGATVPTVRSWTFRSFYGVSVDLQGAIGLLKAAVSGTASTAGGGSVPK